MGADELRMAGFLEREGVGKERVTVSRVWSVGRGQDGVGEGWALVSRRWLAEGEGWSRDGVHECGLSAGIEKANAVKSRRNDRQRRQRRQRRRCRHTW